MRQNLYPAGLEIDWTMVSSASALMFRKTISSEPSTLAAMVGASRADAGC